mgnify:FL=1
MPRLKKFDLGLLSDPALNDKIIEFAEREARELAGLGIGMLADLVRRRLAQRRTAPASTAPQQDWNGRVHAPDAAPTASPYQVLGVAPQASMEEVEHAFRQRVQACHPDHKGGSEQEIRLVLEAIHQIRRERNQ